MGIDGPRRQDARQGANDHVLGLALAHLPHGQQHPRVAQIPAAAQGTAIQPGAEARAVGGVGDDHQPPGAGRGANETGGVVADGHNGRRPADGPPRQGPGQARGIQEFAAVAHRHPGQAIDGVDSRRRPQRPLAGGDQQRRPLPANGGADQARPRRPPARAGLALRQGGDGERLPPVEGRYRLGRGVGLRRQDAHVPAQARQMVGQLVGMGADTARPRRKFTT